MISYIVGTPNDDSHVWKVVPISDNQMLDVRSEDLLMGGLYRKCNTYRGGGGYDQFPIFAQKEFGGKEQDYSPQFIVQLQGCNLDCPYCYVTREGVWGKYWPVTTNELVVDFAYSHCKVFHLMGGAPALQLKYWPELLERLFSEDKTAIFHSDFMLSELEYDLEILSELSKFDRCLYVINIKGLTAEEWERNTRKKFDENLFWRNCKKLQHFDLKMYLTFTGCDQNDLSRFFNYASWNGIDVDRYLDKYFHIDIISYDASRHVDSVPWGGRKE